MKIAIYYPWIYLTSGVERTILEIVTKSKNDYTIFTNHYDRENTNPEFKKLKIFELRKISVKRDLFSVFKAAVIITFQKIDLSGFGALFVHSDGLGDLITIRNGNLPIVCFCHTPLRVVFDEYYRKIAFGKKNILGKFIFYVFAYLFKITDKFLWKRYRYIFFNSQETLRRAREGGLLEKLNTDSYSVLNPGIDLKKIKPTWHYKPYFFLPGRIMWTKNIELGIKSFLIFKDQNFKFKKFKLVIAGQVNDKSRVYFQKLQKLTEGRGDIKFDINPTDEKMRMHYQNSWAVLNTSFNEDWGITLLEAGAFAKPIIAVNKGGPRESQINGKTGFLVKSDKYEFAEKMKYLADNLDKVEKLGRYARKRIKIYDWKKFSQKLDKFFSKLGDS